MTAFLDLFTPIKKGDFGLTEEAIYKSIQAGDPFVPLWGGNQEHNTVDRMVSSKGKTKDGSPVTVFNGEGIIVSLDGSAGSMTYKRNQSFALNHHAGFFKILDKNRIIAEYFALFYQSLLQKESVSEGSKTLTLDQIYSLDYEVPPFPIQNQIMEKIQHILEKKVKITKFLTAIKSLKSRFFTHKYSKYQTHQLPIGEAIDYVSGNSGLTEQFIYQHLQNGNRDYSVLSGSVEDSRQLGKISPCDIDGKKLKVFSDGEGLLIVRKGKAGVTKFLKTGKYSLTDDAYILYLKKDCKYKVDLKWLGIEYKNAFYDYASSSDNGTWNMGGFFGNVLIDIPDHKEQIAVVNLYDKLKLLEDKIVEIDNKIEKIFSKKISK